MSAQYREETGAWDRRAVHLVYYLLAEFVLGFVAGEFVAPVLRHALVHAFLHLVHARPSALQPQYKLYPLAVVSERNSDG